MSYFLAPALDQLRDEIDRKYPGRDKTSDGWIGDPSHAARKSDHNPDYSAGGIVRAIDLDNNGKPWAVTDLVRDVLNAAVGDPRVWYVISNRKIYSRTHGWEARAYGGTNPHEKHVHVSLRHRVAEGDRSPWLTAADPGHPARKTVSKPIDLSIIHAVFKSYALDPKNTSRDPRLHVARAQRALNMAGAEPRLTVDGIIGPATFRAWRRFETARNVGTGRPGVPDRESLEALISPVFRVTS